MREVLNRLFALVLCLGLIACTGCDLSDKDQSHQQDSDNSGITAATTEQDIANIISIEELYGTYASALDETVSFIFTSDEYCTGENNQVIACPLYIQEQGKERIVGGAYSMEISGDVLTVVDWYGEKLFYKINIENDNIVLEFLEEQYEGSYFDAPHLNKILSDLVKQDNQ